MEQHLIDYILELIEDSQPPTVETRGLAEITTLFPRSGC